MMSEPNSIMAVSANIRLLCGKDTTSLVHSPAAFEQDDKGILVLSSGKKVGGQNESKIRSKSKSSKIDSKKTSKKRG